MPESEKIKIAFTLPFNLRFGEGLSRVCLSYIKNISKEKFDPYIIQTDFFKNQRMTEEAISDSLGGIHVITLHRPDAFILRFLPRGILGLAYSLLIEPVIFKIMGRQLFKNFSESIRGTELAYLFNNNLRFLFKDIKVIGSTHSWNPQGMNPLVRKYNKLRMAIWRIPFYHSFPKNGNFFSENSSIKYFTLPNGVDTDFFTPAESETHQTVNFLYVSRLEDCKGMDILPSAWHEFGMDQKMQLTIVGAGSRENEAKEMERKFDNVLFKGVVDEQSLLEMYQNADILLFPSTCDTFGLVVLEGLSSGLYCLVDRSLMGVFDNFYEKGFLTYVFHNSKDLSKALVKATSQINEIRKNKNTAHMETAVTSSWKTVTEKFEENILSL